ncbi:ABC transporter permease [Haloplanus aerogenes]|uniref:ABC transporter permease n=1 Tax=Haloplanus aerogenes TaxID=660522 RepID=A0A3M0DT20_9EURY|nr:ABC transporter permease [Haloplanus aerogenes]AZH25550.1 ABC transporter permease [Haloplanus aerogenes]RMB25264.1 peptide/nickel transport system permease protein [Haloplanus aerogenes]
MAGQDTFETVDWDETGSRLSTLSRRDRGALLTGLALVVVFLYDYLVLPENRPTITFPVEWNVTQLDWLFVATLLALVFYVAVPLYDNRRLTAYYWREFRKNRMAVLSLVYLIVVFLIGVVGPLFLDKPTLALDQAYQPPIYLGVDSTVPVNCVGEVVNGRCQGTMAHPLGTTGDGKDILVLVIYGMQVSMKVGLISTLLVVTIGTAVGTVAAYGGGLVDELLMRYVDIQLVFPAFFLYLLLTYLFGGSLFMFILIFGLTGWGSIARLVRSEALQRAEEEYITAARSAGAGTLYVIRRHLVPNVSNSVITAATLLIPGFILFEASLSFLSLGDPTVPSWGQVIANGRSDLSTAWWVSTFPGVFLFTTILAFNFMGDALRDALDPRQET